MKFTALKKFFSVFFVLTLFLGLIPSKVESQDGVGVAAEVVLLDEQEAAIIDISQMLAFPNPVRVGYVIKLTVTLKGYDGMLLPFHSVYLEADGPGIFTLTQPVGLTGYDGVAIGYITSNVAGVYNVKAYDTTYSERDIEVGDDEDTIFVADGIPILNVEPEYTKGYTNELEWGGLEKIVQYYIESSEYEDFRTISYNSGWLYATDYEFRELESGVKYYYRVKGRNETGAETVWSNVVSSTQDATPPESQVTRVDKAPNGFNITIEASDPVGEVALVDIYVKMDDGEWLLIKSTELDEVRIDFHEIEGFDIQNKPERICFYTRAEDTVGNLEYFDPKETGDYCVGYGLTFQNVVDLINRIAEDVIVTAGDYINDGLEWVVEIVSKNPTLFLILLFVPIILYILIWGYKNRFRFIDIGKWFELWNFRLFPWLLADKKGKPVGVVYDSITREPIKDVLVSLVRKDQVKQQCITDKLGVFKLLPDDYKYKIECWKSGYEFPSKVVKTSKDDIFKIVYLGGEIKIPKKEKLSIGVPIDYDGKRESNMWYWILDFFMDIIRFVNPILLIIGIFVALSLNIIYETSWYYIFVVIYIMLLAKTFGFLNMNRKGWGTVRDEDGKKIPDVMVGIENPKFAKLVDKRKTDEKGRYRFVVPAGSYEIKLLEKKYKIASGGESIKVEYSKGRRIEVVPTITVTRL